MTTLQARTEIASCDRLRTALAVLLLATAAISYWFVKAPVSSFAFAMAALMCWSRPFEDNRARGKPTLSSKGRIVVGATLAAIGVLLLWTPSLLNVGVEAEPSTLNESDAGTLCEEAARDRIKHPSTADFSILGSGFKSFDDGTAIFTTTFTARNGFNLELGYQVACDFDGPSLTGVKIVEAR